MALGMAYLAHSSTDKQFVEAVAKRLGRQQVRFDKWVFEVGQDFVRAITESLGSSSTFVLFASKASLASFWVKFEMNLANDLLKNDTIKASLIFIIDPDIEPSDLPDWMQKSLIKKITSSNAVSRAIQYHLNNIRGLEKTELFFGRNVLMDQFAEKLFPSSGEKPPHILVVSGLEGVGRRTFISHAVRNALSIQLGPILHLRRTDGIDALHVALISELGEVDSICGLADEIAGFRRKPPAEQADAIAELLHRIGEDNVAPCIVDDGALLESSSYYKPEAIALLKSLKRFPETVVALIHTHRPRMSDAEFSANEACYERIPALDYTASKQLLTKRLQLARVVFDADQLDLIVPYLGGYPPAISLAVGLIRDYSLPVVLADKSTLVNFQIQTFAEVLDKLNLTSVQWAVLRLLAAGLELPLESLASAIRTNIEDLAPVVRYLVDLNLVLVSNSVFSIAYPIRFAVQASKGALSVEEFNVIGRSLKEAFWDGQDKLPSYQVLESTISAVLRTDDPDLKPFAGLVLPSLLFRAAKDSYEQWGYTNWEKALGLLKKLLELEPTHRGGLVLLMKIQVKMGHWSDANQTLKQIQELRMPERFALEGYLFWKQRKYPRAVNLYKVALANGERAVEIYHGLASCLFQMGDVKEASRYIDEGLQNRARHNGLLIDLAAKMAIVAQDFDSASDYIEQLRRLNAMTDYHHRTATMFAAMNRPADALPHAREALRDSRGRYEIDCELISILIDLRQFEEAETRLEDLERKDRTSGNRRDVRLGLRLKLLLRQGDWRSAEEYWEPLSDKDSPVQKALRIELLEYKIADKSLSPTLKQSSVEELRIVRGEHKEGLAAFPLLDDYEPDVNSIQEGEI